MVTQNKEKSRETTIKRALIIGAGGGIGRAIAVHLADTGMKLALAGPDAADLMRTAALTGRPLDMLVLPADIAARRGQDDIMHIMEGHFKGLDALVNGAGPSAQALCERALPLLSASDRPVLVDIGHTLVLPAEAVDGVRVVALNCDEGDEAALDALAEHAARIIRGEA